MVCFIVYPVASIVYRSGDLWCSRWLLKEKPESGRRSKCCATSLSWLWLWAGAVRWVRSRATTSWPSGTRPGQPSRRPGYKGWAHRNTGEGEVDVSNIVVECLLHYTHLCVDECLHNILRTISFSMMMEPYILHNLAMVAPHCIFLHKYLPTFST